MDTINVSDIASVGIREDCLANGIKTATLIGTYDHPDHPGSNDWRIRLYEVNGVRVADTNGDPVWEEQDREVFAELLASYNA